MAYPRHTTGGGYILAITTQNRRNNVKISVQSSDKDTEVHPRHAVGCVLVKTYIYTRARVQACARLFFNVKCD